MIADELRRRTVELLRRIGWLLALLGAVVGCWLVVIVVAIAGLELATAAVELVGWLLEQAGV